MREFLTKLQEIRAVEVMKKLQDALYREDRRKIVSTRDNFGKRLEFSVDPLHELRKP
jgi:galactose-1-phosphate uridylyltransferase